MKRSKSFAAILAQSRSSVRKYAFHIRYTFFGLVETGLNDVASRFGFRVLHTAHVERLFLVLSEVPRLKQRLECNLARLNSPSYLDSVKGKLLVLSKAVQEVERSES